MRRIPVTVALALSGGLALQVLSVGRVQAAPMTDCRCLENGGEPGPGDCPCDVLQCFSHCIDTLCPDTPECMLECSLRCSCNSAPSGCLTHVDPGSTPTVPPAAGVKVGVCYSEIPGSSCSGVEAPFHSPVLEGPVPAATAQTPTYDPARYYYYHFDDVLPGNYILREDGCNPFGCWLDTPVRVADQDVEVKVQQLGPRTPPATSTPCLGDRNGDDRVTIEELVGAVNNALSGCPH